MKKAMSGFSVEIVCAISSIFGANDIVFDKSSEGTKNGLSREFKATLSESHPVVDGKVTL